MTDRKAFKPHDFKLDDQGAVTIAFAQLDVIDADRDVSLPGSFPAGKAVPMSAYGHTSWDGALPTGKGTIREDGKWAIFDGQFLMKTDQGRNAYETVKEMGELQEWSYGLNAFDTSYGQRDGQAVRFIKAQDVFEVSPVLKGAGVETHTMAIKSGSPEPDLPYAAHAAWLRDAFKAFTDRTGERAEWRAKEGRGLSIATRDDLAQFVLELRAFPAIADELDALLKATDPAAPAIARANEVAALASMLRANGVDV